MTKDESIYIISTLEYSRQGHFRPGRTKQMTGRLSTHNSSHTSGDMMVVLKEYKVNNAVLVEGIIRKKLAGLLVEKDKEFVMCPFNLLDEIIQLIVENDGQESDLVNKIIDIVFNLKQHTLNSANWMTGIDESIFHQGQMQLIENGTEQIAVFDVANATDAQKQEFVRQCIEVYKITIIQPQLLQVQTTIQIIWKSFQGLLFQQSGLPKSQFKVADWKPAVKTVETEEETLTIKWRGN